MTEATSAPAIDSSMRFICVLFCLFSEPHFAGVHIGVAVDRHGSSDPEVGRRGEKGTPLEMQCLAARLERLRLEVVGEITARIGADRPRFEQRKATAVGLDPGEIL